MWIELHDTARGHPKTKKVARDLKIPKVHALGHLASLWTWVLRYAPDGDLSSFDMDDIADAAQWEGDPETLVRTLVDRSVLDEGPDGYLVHDWDDYSGSLKAGERKKKERDRKRSKRLTCPNLSADTSDASAEVRGSPRTETDSEILSGGVTQNEQNDQNRTTGTERPDRTPDNADRDGQAVDTSTIPGICNAVRHSGLMGKRYRDPSATVVPRLRKLMPLRVEELISAIDATKSGANRPGWTYLASVLESQREAPRPKASSGYHPGTPEHEFADGEDVEI